MSLHTRFLVGLTLILGTAANACSASVAQPVAATPAGVECKGATLQSEAQLAAYARCRTVHGDLRITQASVTDLGALAGLRSVSGTFEISGNPELGDLSGLEQLSSVGVLEISNNAALQSLRGLDGLEHAEVVKLERNGIFKTTGLGKLREVGTLVVRNNPQLISLAGLNELERAGAVEISKNRLLSGYFGLLPRLVKLDRPLVLGANLGLSRREIRALLERVEGAVATPTLAAEPSLRTSSN